MLGNQLDAYAERLAKELKVSDEDVRELMQAYPEEAAKKVGCTITQVRYWVKHS